MNLRNPPFIHMLLLAIRARDLQGGIIQEEVIRSHLLYWEFGCSSEMEVVEFKKHLTGEPNSCSYILDVMTHKGRYLHSLK